VSRDIVQSGFRIDALPFPSRLGAGLAITTLPMIGEAQTAGFLHPGQPCRRAAAVNIPTEPSLPEQAWPRRALAHHANGGLRRQPV